MKINIPILLLTLLVYGAPIAAETRIISTVAAVVNSDIITTYQLDRAVDNLMQRPGVGRDGDDAERAALQQRVLQQLINEKLVEQRIAQLGLRVSEQEVNAAIDDVKTNNNIDQATLETALAAEGLTLAAYREQIRNDILRYKLMAQEINYRAQVTSAEVRRYFEEHIDQYNVQQRLYVTRISFPLPTDRSGDEYARILEQAQNSRRRLLAGVGFDDVLKAVQDIAEGAVMGELVLTDLAPALQQAVGDLKAGEVSEPTELNRQLHLFIVTERQSGEELAFEQARRGIEERLRREKSEQRFVEWEQELRASAYIDQRI